MNADGTLYASPYRAFKPVFDIMRSMEQFYVGQKLRSVAVYISEDTKNDLYEFSEKHTIIDWDTTRIIDAVEIYTEWSV